MVKKVIKYGLLGLLIAIVVIGAIIGYVAATFDPDEYKPKIIKLAKEKKQRNLKLEGDIKLSFFPNISADLGQVQLSEHESEKEFASVKHASVSLKLLPLLKKQLVINAVEINGVQANLIRYQDGRTNIDDLMSKEEKSDQFTLDIDHISIKEATLNYRDESTGTKYELNKVTLKTGRIANGVPGDIELEFDLQGNQPKHALKAKITSRMTPDLDHKTYRLENLDGHMTGQFAEFKKLDLKLKGNIDLRAETKEVALSQLSLEMAGKRLEGDMNLKFKAPKLELTQEKIEVSQLTVITRFQDERGSMAMDLKIPSLVGNEKRFQAEAIQMNLESKRDASQINFKLNSALEGNLDGSMRPERIRASGLAILLDGKIGEQALTALLKGGLEVGLPKQTVIGQLAGKLIDSAVKAKFSTIGFADPHLIFDAEIDELDLDRLLPKSKETKQASSADQPLDLSFLKKLNVDGSLRVGKLKFLNVKASQVKIDLKVGEGKLEINPLSANLYQGSMYGLFALNAANTPKLAVKQSLSDINVGSLIQDFADKDILDGKGNVSMDITSEGMSISAIKRALAGTMALHLTDGAIKGINIAASLRAIKAKMGVLKGEQVQSASKTEKTDFSEMVASFAIKNGVAHNQDLSVKSPLLRINGEGDIDIGADRINYGTKVIVVATSKGQGGLNSSL